METINKTLLQSIAKTPAKFDVGDIAYTFKDGVAKRFFLIASPYNMLFPLQAGNEVFTESGKNVETDSERLLFTEEEYKLITK